MEKSLLVYFSEVATVQSSLYEGGDVGQKLKLSFQQVIAQYRSMIPNFDAFLQQMPEDRYQLFVNVVSPQLA